MSYVLVQHEHCVELYKNEGLVLYCNKQTDMKDLAVYLADLLSNNSIEFITVDSDEYHLGELL